MFYYFYVEIRSVKAEDRNKEENAGALHDRSPSVTKTHECHSLETENSSDVTRGLSLLQALFSKESSEHLLRGRFQARNELFKEFVIKHPGRATHRPVLSSSAYSQLWPQHYHGDRRKKSVILGNDDNLSSECPRATRSSLELPSDFHLLKG